MTPFAFKTACILLGMLSINIWHVSRGISFHSFGWCIILLEFGLKMLPEVSNGIQIRGLGRSLQVSDVVKKPLICVFWIIVLLELMPIL